MPRKRLPRSPARSDPAARLGAGLGLVALLISAGCSGDQAASPTEPNHPTSADPSPATEPSASASAAARSAETCVQQAFEELTATQRAGQLVMAGVPADDPARYRALVRKERLGSVFLAGRTSHSPAAVGKAVARLPALRTETTTIELLVSADQEGGSVQTLRGGTWIDIPSAKTQGTWSTATLTRRTRAWVKQLRRAGVNMNLAPVADTVPAGTESRNPPIGAFGRQYGATPAQVADPLGTVTETMLAGRVIPTVKHFPGLGRVRHNTDSSTRATAPTTATSADLVPFAAGITAGAGVVMISSARYPKIDNQHLAVFSAPVITGLLRGQMDYQGVVMTDDVGRAAAVGSVPRGRRATGFIEAGGDLVLTVVPEAAPTMVDAIVARARAKPAFESKVDASTLRVLRLKQRSGLLTCS